MGGRILVDFVIMKRISRGMNAWRGEGKFNILVQDTLLLQDTLNNH